MKALMLLLFSASALAAGNLTLDMDAWQGATPKQRADVCRILDCSYGDGMAPGDQWSAKDPSEVTRAKEFKVEWCKKSLEQRRETENQLGCP